MFAQVVGVTPGYLTVFPADVAEGRYLDDEDVSGYARIAVLGSEAAQDLFGDQSPIGRTIKIKQTFLRVVGVLESQGSRFFQNLDARIAIPITTAQRDVFGVDYVSFIAMRSASGMNVDYAKEEARWILRDQHNIENPADDPNQDDFTISTQADAINVIGAVGGALTILLSSIAAISLLVGGIGIMNIMLVSVTERTKEIGLRKAVGATQKEILQQFLLEAVMLTGLGGFIGVALGVGVALISGAVVATQVDGWRAVVPLSGVVLAVVVSVAVGLTFGLYPARRAARLDPVEALRYE
jgi:putative ABC transport system permease protein